MAQLTDNLLLTHGIRPIVTLTIWLLWSLSSWLWIDLPALAVNNPCPQGMILIPGGTLKMGTDNSVFVEETPSKNVTVDSFCMDKYEVTNAEFAKFVIATGYITVAELPLSKEQFPDLTEQQRSPGSLVFKMPRQGEIPFLSWWHWLPGANWQHPLGNNSEILGKENYPVVHIAYQDALAFADWLGKSLPTEAQWEYAARGGLEDATYTWGNKYSETKANTWQGIFPFLNTKVDGYVGLAPVGSFQANGYGLYDMAGNVWEWTVDWFTVEDKHSVNQVSEYEISKTRKSFDPNKPTETLLHVIKGGSYLCAPNYCSRYRPAARESQAPDTGTNHIGLRLVKNLY